MATTRNRRRTRQGPKSTTITAVQPVPRPSKPPRTPNVEDLEIRPRPRGVRVSTRRVEEAVYDEVAKVTIGEVVFVVVSLINGKPVHVRRAADLVFGWACGVGGAVYEKLVNRSPASKRGT